MFGVDPKYVDQMKHQFNRIGQILMTEEVLTRAASMLLERQLRSLDAIHLASALTVGSDLKSVVTYDTRMANAARELGMAVSSPGA
jgi:predicted nucleic acid-binding protein